GDDATPDQKKYAEAVLAGVERMERLTRDVLSLSQALQDPVDSKPVDTGACVRNAIEACLPLIQENHAKIVYGSLPAVMANEGHLTQVFQNLLSNALKYRRPETEPVIEVASSIEKGEAVFSVKDNGIGFDPEHAEMIFGLFHRLHGAKYSGSGLGLSICR